MSPSPSTLEKTAFWILLTFLLAAFLWLLRPFYAALFMAAVTALACEPVFNFFSRRLRFKGGRYLAASVTLILLLLFLALPLGAVAALLIEQISAMAPTIAEQLNAFLYQEIKGGGWLAELTQWMEATFKISVNVGSLLQEIVQKSSEHLYQFSPQVIAKTTDVLVTIVISLVLTYFLLAEGAKLYHELLTLSPLKAAYEEDLAREIRQAVRACLYGYVLTATIQALLAGLGFWIAGLQAWPLLGIATFMIAFIPIIGAAGVWVPVGIALLATGRYGMALFIGLYGLLLISGIDNVLKPLLIQGKTRIHSVLLFIAILGGLKVWGPLGLLAGPILVAVLLASLRIYKQDFLGS